MNKSDLEAGLGRIDAIHAAAVDELNFFRKLGLVDEALDADRIATLCRQIISSLDEQIKVIEHAEAKCDS